jgi:hypothetical protein
VFIECPSPHNLISEPFESEHATSESSSAFATISGSVSEAARRSSNYSSGNSASVAFSQKPLPCDQIIDDDDSNLDGFSTLADKKRCKELTKLRTREIKTHAETISEANQVAYERPKSPQPVEKPRTPVPSPPRTISDIISVLSREPETVRASSSASVSVFSAAAEYVAPKSSSVSASVSSAEAQYGASKSSSVSASVSSSAAEYVAPKSSSAFVSASSSSAEYVAPKSSSVSASVSSSADQYVVPKLSSAFVSVSSSGAEYVAPKSSSVSASVFSSGAEYVAPKSSSVSASVFSSADYVAPKSSSAFVSVSSSGAEYVAPKSAICNCFFLF